jgi:hypothetical protein
MKPDKQDITGINWLLCKLYLFCLYRRVGTEGFRSWLRDAYCGWGRPQWRASHKEAVRHQKEFRDAVLARGEWPL